MGSTGPEGLGLRAEHLWLWVGPAEPQILVSLVVSAVHPRTMQVPRTKTEPHCWVRPGPSDPYKLGTGDYQVCEQNLQHRRLGQRGGLTPSPALRRVPDNLFSLVGLFGNTGGFLGSPIFASG